MHKFMNSNLDTIAIIRKIQVLRTYFDEAEMCITASIEKYKYI